MKPPSKKTVRNAIRILAYAVQHHTEIIYACRSLRLPLGRAVDLAIDARHTAAGPYPTHRDDEYRGSCAGGESLLMQGWLP